MILFVSGVDVYLTVSHRAALVKKYKFFFLHRRCILIHVETDAEKFDTLCMMARKLYAFIAGDAKAESADVVSMQQATLGGHTLLQFTKELLLDFLMSIKYQILRFSKKESEAFKLTDSKYCFPICLHFFYRSVQLQNFTVSAVLIHFFLVDF